MRFYSVHEKAGLDDPEARLAVVKDGFCWPALFIPALWLAYHRLWLGLVLYLAAAALLGLLSEAIGLTGVAGFALSLGFAVFVAAEANDWRRRALERRGWRLVAFLPAADQSEAEWRYLARRLGPAGTAPPPPPFPPPFSGRRAGGDTPILGLFAEPRRR
jgi:hypothetical protein